jgi:ABC-type multidrug transport system fused ATPase/permease subunit
MKNFSDYYSVLTETYRKNFFFLLFLLFLNSIFEFISLGAIIPILQSLVDVSFLDIYVVNFFKIHLNYSIEKKQLIILYIFIFVFLFFSKSLIAIIYNNKKWKYIAYLKADLSYKLSKSLFRSNIETIYKKGSTDLIRTLDTELEIFAGTISDALLNVINSILLISAISGVILIVQPFGFLVSIFVFGSLLLIFNLFTKKKIKNYGEVRFLSSKKKIQLIQNFFRSIKEIKIFNSVDYFLDVYLNQLNLLKKSEKKYYAFLQNFKPILEFLAIIFVFCFFLISLLLNKNNTVVFIEIGILCVGSFRVLPAVNSLLSFSSALRFHLPVIGLIKKAIDELKLEKVNSVSNIKNNIIFKNKIIVKNLSYKYLDSDQNILEDISIEVNKGDIIGIKGDTGSGKTTLINLITGFLKPTSGNIIIDDMDTKIYNDGAYMLNVAYVSQDVILLEDTIRNNIAFGIASNKIDDSKVIEALKDSEIYDFIKDQKLGIDTSLVESGLNLSGGQRQRIAIARAYFYNSEMFVLDEPTSALDKHTQIQIIKNLLDKKKTIILITHDEDIIKYCTKVYIVKNKKIFFEN